MAKPRKRNAANWQRQQAANKQAAQDAEPTWPKSYAIGWQSCLAVFFGRFAERNAREMGHSREFAMAKHMIEEMAHDTNWHDNCTATDTNSQLQAEARIQDEKTSQESDS